MSCLNLPELSLAEWGQVLLKPVEGQRHPLSGEFELTDRCNLSCIHCFINQDAANVEALTQELSTSQVMQIIDELTDAGCLNLLFTGGEPLLRKDFSEVYLHARKNGLLVMLFTNGTLISPSIISTLKKAPPVLVEVSLYGATQETYEAITGVPGSYDRFRIGLDLLRTSGLPFGLKSVLMTPNKHELPLMMELADAFGVKFRYDGMIWPRFDGKKDTLQYRLSIEELLELDDDDPERMKAWDYGYELSQKYSMRHERYAYNCGAGYRSFHINSAGVLSPCMMVRKPSYNILEKGFKAAWDALGVVRTIERTKSVPCVTCQAAGICVQCPGWSQLVHQDNESIVDFVCKLAKEREKQIVFNRNLFEEKFRYEEEIFTTNN